MREGAGKKDQWAGETGWGGCLLSRPAAWVTCLPTPTSGKLGSRSCFQRCGTRENVVKTATVAELPTNIDGHLAFCQDRFGPARLVWRQALRGWPLHTAWSLAVLGLRQIFEETQEVTQLSVASLDLIDSRKFSPQKFTSSLPAVGVTLKISEVTLTVRACTEHYFHEALFSSILSFLYPQMLNQTSSSPKSTPAFFLLPSALGRKPRIIRCENPLSKANPSNPESPNPFMLH